MPPTNKGGQHEINLQTATGNRLPVLLSYSAVDLTGKPGLSVVLTDISTRKQAERKILHLNRLYAMLSAVNNTISQGKDRDTLFREFCRIAVELGGFRLAWVGLLDLETGCVNRAAATGETGYLDDLNVTIKDGPEGMTPTGKVVREGTIFLCNDFLQAEITRPWHEKARIHGLLASASVAIKENKVVIGAFSLYAGEQDYFDDQQIGLLQQMGSDLSFALDNLSQRARLREAERQVTIAAERERASAIIHEKERLLSESQRISHIGSWSFDFSNPIIWTEETYRIYAVSPETFIPTVESLIDLIHPDDRPLMQSWFEACATGGNPGEFEFRRLLPDGTVRYLSACGELMRNVDGKAIRMVGTVQDITLMKRHQQQLEYLAHYDSLTSLPNRLLLADRLEQAMAQTQRRGSSLALAYLDAE